MTLDSKKKKKILIFFSKYKTQYFLINYLICLNDSYKQSYK